MKTTISLFFLLSQMIAGQVLQKPLRIEFTTLTRGYQKQVTITPNTVTIAEESARLADGKTSTTRKIGKKDWKKLIAAIQNLQLNEISDLPSPTMRRASDAARTSSLSIITQDGKTYAHTFDNEDPHAKLKPLMEAVSALTR